MIADSFGRYLVQERELRGLSRDEIARVTKIAPNVLDAIENGDAKRMPAKGYLVGYLKSYAAAIGLDPEDVVLRWHEASGIDVEEGSTVGKPRIGMKPRHRAVLWVLFAIVLAVGIFFLLRGGGGDAVRVFRSKASERGPYVKPDDPTPPSAEPAQAPVAPAPAAPADTKPEPAPE